MLVVKMIKIRKITLQLQKVLLVQPEDLFVMMNGQVDVSSPVNFIDFDGLPCYFVHVCMISSECRYVSHIFCLLHGVQMYVPLDMFV